MTTADALAAGTPNYGSTYSPFDSSRYYNQDAQIYYEQIRAQGFQQIQDDARIRDSRTVRSKVSLTKMVAHAARRPEAIAYSRYGQMGAAYAEDRADRIMGGIAATGSAFKTMGSFAAMFGGPATMAAYEGTMAAASFVGIGGAFTQFKEANEIRGMSAQFMAGQAGQVGTNRMSRGGAQQIAAYMAKTDKLSLVMKDGENLNSMKEKMAVLSENRLLDGVRNTEDFVNRFGKLRESVKKMTELYGKTFEEGAAMLGEFRNLGVDATSAQHAIARGMQASAQHGTGFDQTYAAGMKGAMSVQGTGLSAEAGFAMGARAEGSGQTIQQQRLLDSRTVFNLGGPDNLGTAVQRAQMRFLESTAYSSALMSSTNAEGTNFDILAQTMSGERTMQDNVLGVAGNVNNLESLIGHRARASALTSQLMEENPAAASAMAVSNLISLAPSLGLDPATMSTSELAQLAPSIYPGMTPAEMQALMADVQAAASGAGRIGLQNQAVDESRASAQIGLGPVDTISRGIRSNGVILGGVVGATRAGSDMRAGGAEFHRDTVDFFNETFYNQTTIRTTADAVESQRNLAKQGEFDTEGRIYGDTESPFHSEQQADVFKMQLEQGTLGARPVQGSRRNAIDSERRTSGEQTNIFSAEGAAALGLNDYQPGLAKQGIGYTDEALRDRGITYIEDVGYVRQADLNAQQDQSRATADAIAAARESYDPRTMTDTSRQKALTARIGISNILEEETGGFMGTGFFASTKADDMMARADGGGMAEMAGVVQKQIATSLGIDTTADGWQAKLTEQMKTAEGAQVTGNVWSAIGSQYGTETVRRIEGYVAMGVDPIRAKKMTDSALDSLAGLTDTASSRGASGADDAAVRSGADQLDDMDRGTRVQFFAETAELLSSETTDERKAELRAKAIDDAQRNPALLALQQSILTSSDQSTSRIRDFLSDEGNQRLLSAEAAALPEGDLGAGDVEVSTGGVRMEQGVADREAQAVMLRALQDVADTLRDMKGSVASLHQQVRAGSGGNLAIGTD